MKQILIELEDDLAAQMDRVAPGRARKRSEFVRNAIQRALWDIEEQATAEAYRRIPDTADDAVVDPDTWEEKVAGRARPTKARLRRRS